MPWLGVVLCMTWFFALFVVRSLVQWFRTGSIGMNGFRGRVGSTEWFAGVCATAGLILAPLAPIATLFDWPLGIAYFDQPAVHIAGGVIGALGIAGGVAAQLSMGDSWRIGVDSEERTSLVTHGLFRYVRNPIFSFIGVSLFGFFLVVPNTWSLLTLLLTGIGIQLQVRCVEEPYLSAVHGVAYEQYATSVGRFLPRLVRQA